MSTSGAAAGRTPQRRRGDSGVHQAAGHAAAAAAEPSTTDTEPDDSMNVDAIKQILDLVREHELTEFELEQAGVKLRVRKQGAVPAAAAPAPQMAAIAAPALPPPMAAAPTAVPAPPAVAPEDLVELSVITSPIVGTFYRSPDPSSPSFVEVGQRVKKGQTLCIIEAMKVMNEIKAERSGTITACVAEDCTPVQYGDVLFRIK